MNGLWQKMIFHHKIYLNVKKIMIPNSNKWAKSFRTSRQCLVAKYCIMDCEFVIHLVLLLDILTNNQSMATVCSVPQSFIFLRGQGIKVLIL